MNKFVLPLLAVLASLIAGCRSDGYYQDKAVRSAREFLLAESPDMPLMAQEYVKFNRPFLLVSQINGSYSLGTAQICVCWMTPDSPDVYMVYGTSSMSMMEWSPIRVIRKRFEHPQQIFLTEAAKASAALIQQQFSHLSTKSINHIRFTLPGLWKCKFDLNSNPDSPYTAEELAKADKLPRYVMAWKIEENDQVFYSVYGGTAKDDTLKDFKYYFSGIYTEENFKQQLTAPDPLIKPFGGGAN